jgi:DNA-directed RNA polymerase subunit N (RpoN/RPB10)
VSYGDPEVEEQDCTVSGGDVEASVRLMLPCGECGTDLKDHYFEMSANIEHECDPETYKEYLEELKKDGCESEYSEDDEPEYEVEESDNWEATDRYEDKDKHGKPIKNMRYQKHYFGVTGTVKVKCLKCGEIIDVELGEEEQASAFDDCQ